MSVFLSRRDDEIIKRKKRKEVEGKGDCMCGGARDYFGGAGFAWRTVDADAFSSSTSIGTFVGSPVSGFSSVNASSYRSAVMYGAVYMRFSGISGCDIPRIGPRAARDRIYVSAYSYNQLRFWALGRTRRSILTTSLEFHSVRMRHG